MIEVGNAVIVVDGHRFAGTVGIVHRVQDNEYGTLASVSNVGIIEPYFLEQVGPYVPDALRRAQTLADKLDEIASCQRAPNDCDRGEIRVAASFLRRMAAKATGSPHLAPGVD